MPARVVRSVAVLHARSCSRLASTFFLGLGRQAITDADEAFYAEASREMVESGDWLTPRFNYQHRWQKPVLYYWLTAATYLVDRTHRIGGAALVRAVGARARAAHLALGDRAPRHGATRRRLARGGDRRHQLRLLRHGAARTARPAAHLLHHARRSGPRCERSTWVAGRRLAAGSSGFLMKGPVALVVPALVLLPICVARAAASAISTYADMASRPSCRRDHRPAVVRRDVARARQRISSELLRRRQPRALRHRALQRGAAVLVLCSGSARRLMPWSLYLAGLCRAKVCAQRRAQRQRRSTDADWRLLLWAIMPLLFFTLSVGKQPRYILPVLPPLAVLLARGLMERIDTAGNHALVARRRDLGNGRDVCRARPAVRARWSRCLINAYPAATWGAVCLLGCSAIVLAWHRRDCGVARTCRSPPVSRELVTLVAVQFGALAGVRPEAVEQLAALIRTNRQRERADRRLQRVRRGTSASTRGLPRMELFSPEAGGLTFCDRRSACSWSFGRPISRGRGRRRHDGEEARRGSSISILPTYGCAPCSPRIRRTEILRWSLVASVSARLECAVERGFRPRVPSGKDLARVQDAVRVERCLHALHQRDLPPATARSPGTAPWRSRCRARR